MGSRCEAASAETTSNAAAAAIDQGIHRGITFVGVNVTAGDDDMSRKAPDHLDAPTNVIGPGLGAADTPAGAGVLKGAEGESEGSSAP